MDGSPCFETRLLRNLSIWRGEDERIACLVWLFPHHLLYKVTVQVGTLFLSLLNEKKEKRDFQKIQIGLFCQQEHCASAFYNVTGRVWCSIERNSTSFQGWNQEWKNNNYNDDDEIIAVTLFSSLFSVRARTRNHSGALSPFVGPAPFPWPYRPTTHIAPFWPNNWIKLGQCRQWKDLLRGVIICVIYMYINLSEKQSFCFSFTNFGFIIDPPTIWPRGENHACYVFNRYIKPSLSN